MGGHQSRQSLSVSSDIVTAATLSQSQDCISVSDGKNVLNVFGTGNVVQNVTQDMQFSINQNCSQMLQAKDDFQQKLNAEIAQSLKNQDVALTSWLTPGSSRQSETISNSVTTNITTDLVQKCLTQMSGTNVINVQGSANVVQNVVQKQSQSIMAGCMQGNKQSLSTMTDITDTVNQNQQNVSKSPLSFITDAISATVRNVVVAIAIMFISVVLLVVLGKVLSHRRSPAKDAGPGQ